MTVAVGVLRSPYRVVEPVAKRLNKNALLLVLGLGGVTAAVAVVSVAPRRSAALGSAGSDSVAAAVPVRRQRPELPPRSMMTVQPASVIGETAVISGGGVVTPPVIAFEQRTPRVAHGAGRSRDSFGRGAAGHGPNGDAEYERALVSGLMVGGRRDRPDSQPIVAAADSDSVTRVVSVGAPVEGGEGMGTRDRGVDGRPADRERERFLASGTAVGQAGALAPSIEQPVTRFELEAGSVIPAEMVTDVNSDLPGAIVAQVTRAVYDSRTESTVLVPKGTRLIGAYDDRVVPGQSRVLVAWSRMVFPDGRSVRLPGIEGVDARGAAGVEGSVNDHLGHVFVSAALMSALSAGAQLSQPQLSSSAYTAPSVGQVAAGAMGQQLSTVGLEVVRRGLNVKPTITVRGGAAVQVLLTQDLVFVSGYVDGR